jgi:hypothetical protein
MLQVKKGVQHIKKQPEEIIEKVISEFLNLFIFAEQITNQETT